jgi:hypothetical protein
MKLFRGIDMSLTGSSHLSLESVRKCEFDGAGILGYFKCSGLFHYHTHQSTRFRGITLLLSWWVGMRQMGMTFFYEMSLGLIHVFTTLSWK